MQLSDKIKKFSVEQTIDYLNRNPVKNLPKLLDWADTFCAGKFEGQRRAIRKACLDPADAQYVGGCIAGGRRALDRPHEPRVCRAPVQQVRQLCRLLGAGGGKALARQPGRGEVPRQAGSRRSEKEVKRAQRTKNIVCKERKSTVSQSGGGAFSSLPLEGTARAHSPAQGKASSALPVLRRVTAKRKNVHGRVLPCTFRVRWGFPGLALRRVSCAGRGPGSGCAAARGRGPGAGCRRHSPGRGSAAGCAGRRLRLP